MGTSKISKNVLCETCVRFNNEICVICVIRVRHLLIFKYGYLREK